MMHDDIAVTHRVLLHPQFDGERSPTGSRRSPLISSYRLYCKLLYNHQRTLVCTPGHQYHTQTPRGKEPDPIQVHITSRPPHSRLSEAATWAVWASLAKLSLAFLLNPALSVQSPHLRWRGFGPHVVGWLGAGCAHRLEKQRRSCRILARFHV
jgi:hypothetical protein